MVADWTEKTAADTARSARRDVRVMGLVGLAHASSHFFQLVLPPLFPLLRDAFGVSYTELGFAMALFYLSSGLMQTPSGFLVDRFGARMVLFSGIALLASATLLIGFVPSYWLLLPLVVIAGIGNSVFHPADYSILTATIDPQRIGRAYSVHTLGGNIGWAAAPVTMLGLATLFGWRSALIAAGLAGLAILALLLLLRGQLDDDAVRARVVSARREARIDAGQVALAPLLSRPVVMCFLYFLLLSIALIGVQAFLPATLLALHAVPLASGSVALTAFLVGGSAGIVVGGILADRTPRHQAVVAVGLSLAALIVIAVASLPIPTAALVAAIAIAGFASGSTTPSRDMLVRAAAPRGATGRVFGFVYSGLDAGATIAPFVIGLLLDHDRPALVLWFVALTLFLAVFTAISLRPRTQAAVAAAE